MHDVKWRKCHNTPPCSRYSHCEQRVELKCINLYEILIRRLCHWCNSTTVTHAQQLASMFTTLHCSNLVYLHYDGLGWRKCAQTLTRSWRYISHFLTYLLLRHCRWECENRQQKDVIYRNDDQLSSWSCVSKTSVAFPAKTTVHHLNSKSTLTLTLTRYFDITSFSSDVHISTSPTWTTCRATSRPHHFCLFSEAVWRRTSSGALFLNFCSVLAKWLLPLLTLQSFFL